MYGSCHPGSQWRGRMRAAWRDYAERMDAAGRGRHGGRFGDDGEGRGGGFGGFGGFGPRGRALGHGDLKLVLLALIAAKPSHGYELIRAIGDKFNGAYAPSPGAVYPTLTMLEEQDYIRAEAAEGAKREYAIIAEGQTFLKANETAVDGIMTRIDLAAAAFARHSTPDSVREAVRTLRESLQMRRGPWTEAEAERVRGLIEKTARDIVGASGS